MSLSYYFTFSAPAAVAAVDLLQFLKSVEVEAHQMGFQPTTVLDAVFDSPERQEFARRLTTGHRLESDKLKGVVILRENQIWSHDPVHGSCRVIPERGVLLVITDKHKIETLFGFFLYPAALIDLNGREIVSTGITNRWVFRNFVDSPDERFRKIVKRFADAGYVESEKDEFATTRKA